LSKNYVIALFDWGAYGTKCEHLLVEGSEWKNNSSTFSQIDFGMNSVMAFGANVQDQFCVSWSPLLKLAFPSHRLFTNLVSQLCCVHVLYSGIAIYRF
jgi:hypothetical protein